MITPNYVIGQSGVSMGGQPVAIAPMSVPQGRPMPIVQQPISQPPLRPGIVGRVINPNAPVTPFPKNRPARRRSQAQPQITEQQVQNMMYGYSPNVMGGWTDQDTMSPYFYTSYRSVFPYSVFPGNPPLAPDYGPYGFGPEMPYAPTIFDRIAMLLQQQDNTYYPEDY